MRRTIFSLALSAVLLGGLAANVSAANVTFTVQNQRGVAQAGTRVMPAPDGGTTAWTNGYGQVTLNVTAGQNLYFARGGFPSSHACAPPEGGGVQYQVPAPPVNATVTLPNSNGEPYAPTNSNNERWMVGKVNQERARLGRQPLYISQTINEAADRYGSYLTSAGIFGDHCAIGDQHVRMLDNGWPIRTPYGGETICWYGPSGSQGFPPECFDGWMNSPGHYAALTNPSFGSIGMAEVNGTWVADLGAPCPGSTEAAERCRMTSDTGDPNLPVEGLTEEERALKRAIKKCKKRKTKKARRKCIKKAKKKARR